MFDRLIDQKVRICCYMLFIGNFLKVESFKSGKIFLALARNSEKTIIGISSFTSQIILGQ